MNDPLTIAKKGEPTFAKFLSHIVKDQNVVFKYDEHWYPIYGLCRPCHVKFDFVLKVESLNEESIKLLDKVRTFTTFDGWLRNWEKSVQF